MAVSLLLALSPVFASTTEDSATVPIAPVEVKKTPRSVDELIHDAALQYGVSEVIMRRVIKCESGFNPNAVGDGGASRGLVQIHKPSWPSISDAEAFDPKFASLFLAEKLSNQQGYLWTCYRMLVQ